MIVVVGATPCGCPAGGRGVRGGMVARRGAVVLGADGGGEGRHGGLPLRCYVFTVCRTPPDLAQHKILIAVGGGLLTFLAIFRDGVGIQEEGPRLAGNIRPHKPGLRIAQKRLSGQLVGVL